MPPQKGKSGLLGKLGDKLVKAHEAAKGAETKLSSAGELPAGIENGIAQLKTCKISQYEKGEAAGEYFFYARGIVKSPAEVGGTPIKGLGTSIMEPICDTPKRSRKTVKDHIDWVYNQLRLLGIDTNAIDLSGAKGVTLESVCAALEEQKPYFRFRTWKGEKATEGRYKDQEPRVNHDWRGVVEDFVDPDEEGGGVEDETTQESEPEGESEPEKEAEAEPEAEAEAPGEDEPEPDLDALAKVADDKKRRDAATAAEAINEYALKIGLTEEEISDATSWKACVKLIRDKQAESAEPEQEEEPAAEEEEEWTGPKKGEIYKFKPIDPKTKKPFIDPKTKREKKPIECEVLSADTKLKTCKLKSLDDNKEYAGVKWDSLESA